MPQIRPEQLVQAIADAISASGYVGKLASSVRRHPLRFVVAGQNTSPTISIYAWTLTFGGRKSLPDEYRIQMTSVDSPLPLVPDGPAVLVGYEPKLGLFAGFDLERHRTFTIGSPSVQTDVNALRRAEHDGLSFHRKSNAEIAIGIRPDMFMAYAMNAAGLHRFGREASVLNLLNQAVHAPAVPPLMPTLTAARKRLVSLVSLLTRDAAFRRRIAFAYGDRCAVTRVQLRLVDAAHILPVGAKGSTDDVQNGIALSPTYHRAFDAGLIYLNENYEMSLNQGQLAALRNVNLAGGIERFLEPLGQIFLPPDPNQRPAPDFIRRANRFRQIVVR